MVVEDTDEEAPVQGDGSAATAMLGVTGFVLLAVSEFDGELEQAVETAAVEEFCRSCGVQAVPHGRRPVRVRDLPVAGKPVTLIWVKRVWRCAEPRCSAGTWSALPRTPSSSASGLAARITRWWAWRQRWRIWSSSA